MARNASTHKIVGHQIARHKLLFILMALIAIIPLAHAEQKKVLGDWDVHYIALNTTFLTPKIAKENGIVRSKYNALINISVLDKKTQEAQRVSLTGTATNLLGNSRPLEFKRVQEGDAIYYLAVMSFRDKETFHFSVDITNGNTRQNLTFQQEMRVE